MGRKTVVQHIYEGLGEDFKDEESCFLLLYDFELKAGQTIHHNFFTNLQRILDRGDGRRVQRSVLECGRLKTARAIEALAGHYGVRDVDIYEVQRKLKARPYTPISK